MNKANRIILFLLLAGTPFGLKAQERNVNVLYLDGSNHVRPMSEIERIEIGDGEISVVPKSGAAEKHPMNNIDRIVLDDKTTVGIGSPRTAGNLRLTVSGGRLDISGAAEGSRVEMFNAAGQLTARTVCRGGMATISTASLTAGTYIVKAGGNTYKITVK